jgi:hypothetical protein
MEFNLYNELLLQIKDITTTTTTTTTITIIIIIIIIMHNLNLLC